MLKKNLLLANIDHISTKNAILEMKYNGLMMIYIINYHLKSLFLDGLIGKSLFKRQERRRYE